jgi:phosphohistidine phosphatase
MTAPFTLYLLRHGDALSPAGVADADRPLSKTGEEQIALAADFLRTAQASVGCIIASPLTRALQTAAIVARTLGVEKTLRSEYLVPGAAFQSLLQDLEQLPFTSALLVGHEPHLSSLLSWLTVGGSDLKAGFQKGSLACVEGERPLREGGFTLKWLLHVAQLRRL